MLQSNPKDLLNKLEECIKTHKQKIVDVLHKDYGKAKLEAFLAEYYYTLTELKYAKKRVNAWRKPKCVRNVFHNYPGKMWVQSQALGEVLIIGPNNYPFQLTMVPAISALAGGNKVVVKPAQCSKEMEQIFQSMQKALNSPYFSVQFGGADFTQNLIETEKFDHIFFTGTKNAGLKIMQSAAKKGIPVSLELGSVNPCFVNHDVNISVAAKRIVLGKFFNAGQTCVAPNYVLIHRQIYKSLVEEIKKYVQAFYSETQSNLDNINFKPQLLEKDRLETSDLENERFDSILPVAPYDNIEDEINRIKSTNPNPLALYIFSKSNSWIENINKEFSSATVGINDMIKQIANPNAPFGGIGSSGFGQYHGKAGFDLFTHRRAFLKRPFWGDAFSIYPPYSNKWDWLMKWL